MAKICLGCLEISIETGRHTRPRLSAEARVYQVCDMMKKELKMNITSFYSVEDMKLNVNFGFENLQFLQVFSTVHWKQS